jgi:hypothetical protein
MWFGAELTVSRFSPTVIERVDHGRYGYRAKLHLPPIAEGYGAATFAEARIGGDCYLRAGCAGGRLQVHGTIAFSNGDLAPATLVSPCEATR